MKDASLARRVFAAVLVCYPSRFTNRFGTELVQVFVLQYRRAVADKGLRGAVVVWTRVVRDIATVAPRQWADAFRAEPSMHQSSVGLLLLPAMFFWIATAITLVFASVGVRIPAWPLAAPPVIELATLVGLPALVILAGVIVRSSQRERTPTRLVTGTAYMLVVLAVLASLRPS